MSAALLVGPLLRYLDDTVATIWVETNVPCLVRVKAGSSLGEARTFTVHGHYYALVTIDSPIDATPYQVYLDDVLAWPLPDSPLPPPQIRPVRHDAPIRIAAGSCRIAASHGIAHTRRYGADMLRRYAQHLAHQPPAEWPTALLLLGDQIYADAPPSHVREFIATRRDVRQPPGHELLDFTEYAKAYQVSWMDPWIRWLLASVPSMMIFDDHDIRDDWNTSAAWRTEMQAKSWWQRRIMAGLGSYFVYQHVGNLPPTQLADDPLWKVILNSDKDSSSQLDEFAEMVDSDPTSYRWSYHRDLARNRFIMFDTRCSRVLTPGQRTMVDDSEWAWFDGLARGGVDHLIIGSSLPVLLLPAIHHAEQWNERISDGASGAAFAKIGERIRRRLDLEHWASFSRSFTALVRSVTEVARGERGEAPKSIQFLSGDVHYSYLSRVSQQNSDNDKNESGIFQLVCSPLRNPLESSFRRATQVASWSVTERLCRALSAMAGVSRPPWQWRQECGLWFDNAILTVDYGATEATARWWSANRVPHRESESAHLRLLGEYEMTGSA